MTCTVVDDCVEPAVLQAPRACGGCAATSAELEVRVTAKADQRAKQQAVIDSVREQCVREERGPDDAESLVLHLALDAASTLGEDLEQLQAASDRISVDHTHPDYACAGHVQLLDS